jgi:hypothetical protein
MNVLLVGVLLSMYRVSLSYVDVVVICWPTGVSCVVFLFFSSRGLPWYTNFLLASGSRVGCGLWIAILDFFGVLLPYTGAGIDQSV